jgi:peptidoglycan/LPS O-acetylase OafA/YrhL
VYLFAYPIQQAYVQLAPDIPSPFAVFLVAAPLSLAYAALSWRFIEWPILSRKKQIAASVTALFSRAGQSLRLLEPSIQPSD